MDATDSKKPFKVKDVTRSIKKAVVASTLEEIRSKIAEKFEKAGEEPTIHLDSDGTEIDDEEYFRTLDENTELIAVFPGEHWIDPTQYVTITGQNGDTNGDHAATAAEHERIQRIVGQLKNNLCNVSVLSDSDLDSLSNMDPNSLVDITGKDFIEQLKDSGRPQWAKRTAQDRINLLKLLRDGAIFCSERYPEEAEAIDMEISRQLNIDSITTTITAATATTKGASTVPTIVTTFNTETTTTITTTTTPETITTKTKTNEEQKQTITAKIGTKTINEKNIELVKSALGRENSNIQAHSYNNNNNNNNNNTNSGNTNNNDIRLPIFESIT